METTTVKIRADVLNDARAIAEKERRSFSAQLELWLEQIVTKQGE